MAWALNFNQLLTYPEYDYIGHSGDVGNTSGMFWCDIRTDAFPEGYYISYNYNYEGINTFAAIDSPVQALMLQVDQVPDSIPDSLPGPTSVASLSWGYQVTVYPNPAEDHAVLSILSGRDEPVIVDLFAIDGQHISSISYRVRAGINQRTIALDNLSSGVYFLKCVFKDHTAVKKIILR